MYFFPFHVKTNKKAEPFRRINNNYEIIIKYIMNNIRKSETKDIILYRNNTFFNCMFIN